MTICGDVFTSSISTSNSSKSFSFIKIFLRYSYTINIKVLKKTTYLYIQHMEIIGMKKKYSFTIEETLMDWFRVYVREESTTMSAVLNQYVLSLKRGN